MQLVVRSLLVSDARYIIPSPLLVDCSLTPDKLVESDMYSLPCGRIIIESETVPPSPNDVIADPVRLLGEVWKAIIFATHRRDRVVEVLDAGWWGFSFP